MPVVPIRRLQCGTWDELGDAARTVRMAVFVAEQGIPESEEWDADDATAIHAVLRCPGGEPLATGRLILSGDPDVPDESGPGHARIGRMAVLRSARGQGLGREVLNALIDRARQRGIQHIGLHAQVAAEPFYLQSGFEPQGPVFDEVGIAHRRMVLQLWP